jgi:hypothetical protein
MLGLRMNYIKKPNEMKTETTDTTDPCPVCLRTIQQINEGNSDCYCTQ